MNGLTLDGKNGLLYLSGSCGEVRDLCQALCCRRWSIPLTKEEYQSGRFTAEKICTADNSPCGGISDDCKQRLFRLKPGSDNACSYLSAENKCRIYEQRPQVCKKFSCADGWTIGPIRGKPVETPGTAPDNRDGLPGNLSDDLVFEHHPFFKLKTVFCAPGTPEAVLVIKPAGKCCVVSNRAALADDGITEALLVRSYALINGTYSLGAIETILRRENGQSLSKRTFSEMVRALARNRLIILKPAFPL
ncbi:MAG: YkgJ family cysteine cluster protein [Chitinivibrionales bacterium]|nr:YkgJ family cysteine cluster protein [Chitinivibrionales bacterium]